MQFRRLAVKRDAKRGGFNETIHQKHMSRHSINVCQQKRNDANKEITEARKDLPSEEGSPIERLFFAGTKRAVTDGLHCFCVTSTYMTVKDEK